VSLAEAIIVGLCTAVATAFLAWLGHMLVAYLQRNNEKARYFRERLLERYSELVALATAELERARAVESIMALGGKDEDYAEAAKIEAKRHALRLDLLRVSLQIKLFETDDSLTKRVEELAKAQPFMAFPFPPHWGEGNYNERFDKYKLDIAAFEEQLTELVSAVLQRHSANVLGVRG
jgi:hypothetical protein